MNILCRVQQHHKYSIPMLYALQSAGKYIRCYRCDRQVPKPRPFPKRFRGIRLARWN